MSLAVIYMLFVHPADGKRVSWPGLVHPKKYVPDAMKHASHYAFLLMRPMGTHESVCGNEQEISSARNISS